MADRRLEISTDSLKEVGTTCINLSQYVEDIMDSIGKTINQVTSKEEWASDASTEYYNQYQELLPRIQSELDQLSQLGPELQRVSGSYEQTEQDIKAQMIDVGGINS